MGARRRILLISLACAVFVLSGCSSTAPTTAPDGSASRTQSPTRTTTLTAAATPTAAPTATPAPLPPYSIAALRARPRTAGAITVGSVLGRGTGYTKHSVSWVSGGAAMTGVLDIPDGPGPFAVVIVNHGYVPVGQYYVGQDSSKYADPLAQAGFITVSPNYPGYSGSGPGAGGVPSIVAEAISDIDLISALPSLPHAGHHTRGSCRAQQRRRRQPDPDGR